MSFKTQKSCLHTHTQPLSPPLPTMLSPMRHRHRHDMAILEKLGHNKVGAH